MSTDSPRIKTAKRRFFFRQRFNQAGYTYLAFDHRGHGASSGTMQELTVTKNLEDLESILNACAKGFKNLVLIGSSMGGLTAAWYTVRHPGQVTANLLIAPAFRFFENRERDLGPEGIKRLKKDGEISIRNEWVEVIIGQALLDDSEHYPFEKLIPDYRTPTLILHGTEDASVPFEDSVDLTQKTKARPLDLLLIAGGDHRLMDHKEELFKSMLGFCKRQNLLP